MVLPDEDISDSVLTDDGLLQSDRITQHTVIKIFQYTCLSTDSSLLILWFSISGPWKKFMAEHSLMKIV